MGTKSSVGVVNARLATRGSRVFYLFGLPQTCFVCVFLYLLFVIIVVTFIFCC